MTIGLSPEELNVEIERRMAQLDEAQEETEQFGPFGDLLRLAAQAAFHRSAELIVLNNERITQQLRAAGVALPTE